MTRLIEQTRKTSPLKHPTLPCLSKYYTINLLSGCPYRCQYCYTQSFRSHPGWDTVVFYRNTLDLLKSQLPRMRRKPGTVYFSTACEPFVPDPQVQRTLFQIMRILLDNDVAILISTKSHIPSSFLGLFSAHRRHVYIQVGLTTSDDAIRQVLEPGAPSVSMRLETMAELATLEIPFDLRADPLIPELTDTDANLTHLFETVARVGCSSAAASYLFMRPGNLGAMKQVRHHTWSFSDMYRKHYTQTIENYCGNSDICVAATEYRRERFNWMTTSAEKHGLTLNLCRCKNPDVTDMCCHPPMPTGTPPRTATLFDLE